METLIALFYVNNNLTLAGSKPTYTGECPQNWWTQIVFLLQTKYPVFLSPPCCTVIILAEQ